MYGRVPWVVATVISLGVAAGGWLHSRPRTDHAATADEAGPTSSEDPLESNGAQHRDRSVRLHDGLDALAAALANAVTPRRACAAFEDLARSHDERAVEAIAYGLRGRHDITSRQCGVDAIARVSGPAAISELFRLVDDEEPAILRSVFTALANSGVPDALSLVRLAAERGRVDQQHAALVALGSAHVRDAAPRIATALDHAAGSLARRELLTALGDAGDPAAVPTIIRYTRDPDNAVREGALNALGLLDGPEAVTALVDIMRGAGAREASAAANALALSRMPAARAALIEAAAGAGAVAMRAAEALVDIDGPDVDAAMSALLASDNPAVLGAGIERVTARHLVDAIPRLAQLAEHPMEELRSDAIDALARLETPAAHDALEAIAARQGWSRMVALGRLVEIPARHDRAIALLIAIVRDETEGARSEAVQLLAQDGSAAARQVLLEMAHSDEASALGAITALGSLRDAESLHALQEIATGPNAATHPEAATEALGQLTQRGGPGSEAERIVLDAAHAAQGPGGAVATSPVSMLETPAGAAALMEFANSTEAPSWQRAHALDVVAARGGLRDPNTIERLSRDADPSIASFATRRLAPGCAGEGGGADRRTRPLRRRRYPAAVAARRGDARRRHGTTTVPVCVARQQFGCRAQRHRRSRAKRWAACATGAARSAVGEFERPGGSGHGGQRSAVDGR